MVWLPPPAAPYISVLWILPPIARSLANCAWSLPTFFCCSLLLPWSFYPLWRNGSLSELKPNPSRIICVLPFRSLSRYYWEVCWAWALSNSSESSSIFSSCFICGFKLVDCRIWFCYWAFFRVFEDLLPSPDEPWPWVAWDWLSYCYCII